MNRINRFTDTEANFPGSLPDSPNSPNSLKGKSQAGGGLLGVVAALGATMVLVQGTMYYKAKGSAKFVATEKNKILAQQLAEAGVEENIADLGSRKFKVTSGMTNYPTYDHKALGDGNYSSQVSMVSSGPLGDTVDLTSIGRISNGSVQTVLTRLRLKNYLDSVAVVNMVMKPQTTTVIGTKTVTTTTTTVKAPATMPAIVTTAAYTSCMSGIPSNCSVCHVPGGNAAGATVLNIPRATISPVHGGHVGDYISLDGTCNLYAPVTTTTNTTVPDTVTTTVSVLSPDTTYSVDTIIKVKTLSWR